MDSGRLLGWSWKVALLALFAVVAGSLLTIVRRGPRAGLVVIGRVFREVCFDLVKMSPRRVWALAWLAVKESIRRGVLVGFGVLFVILLFGAWFLDVDSTHPAQLYLAVVLTSTSWLVLLLMLFLSAFSLPADIKSRTIHTVVTKPVRTSEVVLGRMLGIHLDRNADLVRDERGQLCVCGPRSGSHASTGRRRLAAGGTGRQGRPSASGRADGLGTPPPSPRPRRLQRGGQG